MTKKHITERIISNLKDFKFTENQILGFMFHLGYTIDQYSKYIKVYGNNGIEVGLMVNNPFSYLLDDDFEVEENLQSYDSDELRSCYYTFSKVIHEVWVGNEQSLDSFINVGPQFLFTGEIQSEIWEKNEGKPFQGANIDEGFLDFFECIGNLLADGDIIDYYECLWYGQDLYFGSALDDLKSYSYVVDKINTVMSPYLKMLLNYPINVEIDKAKFDETDLFTNIFRASIILEDNKIMRKLSVLWQKKSMFDDEGDIYDHFDLEKCNLGSLLIQFAYDGFQFKYSLNSVEFNEIYSAGNVLKLEQFEGKDIDLNTYASIIAQITHQQFGYDYRQSTWLNNGVYMQFLTFYFMLSMRYSVYLKNLIEK